MKRALAYVGAVLIAQQPLWADVTVTSVTTIEGGAVGVAANAAPTMTTRVKGQKARFDLEALGRTLVALADVAAKQVTVLHPDQKTADIVTPSAISDAAPLVTAKSDATFKPTGQTRTIDGITCDEYTFTANMSLTDVAGAQLSAHVADSMKGLQVAVRGSVWTSKSAPGADEYVKFFKAADEANLSPVLTSTLAGLAHGFDRIFRALAGSEGIAYLSEMTLTVDGTGQMADMLRQMGPTTITTKLSKISVDAIADEIFTVPPDYKVIKQF